MWNVSRSVNQNPGTESKQNWNETILIISSKLFPTEMYIQRNKMPDVEQYYTNAIGRQDKKGQSDRRSSWQLRTSLQALTRARLSWGLVGRSLCDWWGVEARAADNGYDNVQEESVYS